MSAMLSTLPVVKEDPYKNYGLTIISEGNKIIKIYSIDRQGRGTGTGFYVSHSGHTYLVTARHVVHRGENGGIRTSPNFDLSMIRMDEYKGETFKLSTKTPKKVTAYGWHGREERWVHLEGNVVGRTLLLKNNHKTGYYWRTDFEIIHGMSGGPLVNESGEVVGVNCMILPDNEGVIRGYCAPTSEIIRMINNW